MKSAMRSALVSLTILALTAGTASAANPTVYRGERGANAALVQRLLTHSGEPVAITELVGPTTEGLIRRFQTRQNLSATGVVNAATWRALQPTLRRGSSGQAVQALQVALNERHPYHLATDGIFGPLTESAVRAFQRHMGLTADGIVGPQTWGALTGHFVELAASGPGWYRYSTGNPNGGWGTAHTIATFQGVANNWRAAGYGTRLGVGDISEPHGGPIDGHVSHQRGVDVDIRILRNDGQEAPVAYWDAGYSRQQTQRLVNLLLGTGEVEVIFFNDPNVTGVQAWPGHDYHMHVRLKR